MNAVGFFEPATPAMIVARALDGGTPPLGLDQPLPLLGGERLGPGGIPFAVMHEHQPDFLRWVEATCEQLLASERPWFGGARLLLTGPRGAGRTHAARWLARVTGVPHVILNLTDPLIAANHAASRSVSEALLASPLTVAMAAARCANPVATVLGVDQVGDDVTAGLAAMMDPELGRAWSEDQLGIHMDFGEVAWVLQCDDPRKVPSTLRHGADLVRLEPPPASVDSVMALSILLEVIGDLRLDPANPAVSWTRVRKKLANYRGAHANVLYAAMVAALTGILRDEASATADGDHDYSPL